MEPEKTPRERVIKFIKDLVAPAWQPSRDRVLWVTRIVLVFVVLLAILTLIGWPFGITLWAWVKLLIVPAVLAIGGYLFNSSQTRAIQAAAERRAQDEALQAYLDHMSDMLILGKGQPSLYDEHAPDSLRTVARARTLTVLPRLAGDRKARVVQFLYEADLITRGRPIVDLALADLREANLTSSNLINATLSGANLSGANLSGAYLSEPALKEVPKAAELIYADLSGADLHRADLSRTTLSRTVLRGAVLRDVDLSGADLSYADLCGAKLYEGDMGVPPGLIVTTRLTNEQIEQRAKSLEGATMPNGQKYEDWLKSRGEANGGS